MVGALGLSCGYLLFVLVLIIWAAFGINYDSAEYRGVEDHLAKGITFREQLEGAVKLSLWISPLATAPVLALTGRGRLVPRRASTRNPPNPPTP